MRQYRLLKEYKTYDKTIPEGTVSYEANRWSARFGTPGNDVEVRVEELERYTEWFERINIATIDAATGSDGTVYITIKNLNEPLEHLKVWLDRTLND